jgi:hypothetical protein
MFRINKKVLVIAGLAILLAVTGVLNWKFAADKKARQQAEGNGGTEQTVSSFADFRTERERVRTQELTSIDSIINNENTDTQTLAEAQKMKLELTDTMEKELLIEGLLKAKGFEDAVITISDTAVNVIVKQKDLTKQQVAQVLEIVLREAGDISAENVKISEAA